MPPALVSYDKILPEIPGRCPWERPTSFLVKDGKAPTGWRVDESGRRPSLLLLVPKIRAVVDAWRSRGYPGASDVTRRLLEYWFDEDHDVAGFPAPFRYWFCQREAIETLVWLVEVARKRDAQAVIKSYATVFQRDLLSRNIEFQVTMDGQRQVRRYVPELEGVGVQDLPPENLRRFAFKMATGSGKTWVMAMAIVWSYFHRKMVPGSDLSTNSLIVAPNVIVYQRLEKDFAANRIFYELPLVPPEWGRFGPKVILRGEPTEPDPSGNLFLTNIHQLYESREEQWTPDNAVDALLGKKPAKDLAASGQRSMLERVKSLKDLVVLNDEAHHVHDPDLAWSQCLLGIHEALPKGLAAWLDFSATPKDQKGMYFPWIVVDYPLAQAVEDRIVKAPIIVTKEDDSQQPKKDPENVSARNVATKYGYWLQAAVARLKEHEQVYKRLDRKPILFLMAEKNVLADALGKHLHESLGFKEGEVQVIHTDTTGEVTKGDVEEARTIVRDIDQPKNKVRAIVSVMMLREGWDVRNVTVVLGLRPFTAKAEILPEQVIGRGLRLMTGVSPDKTQTLEVLGTRNLLQVLRDQLEAEGVGVATTKSQPPRPVTIEPIQDRIRYDIAIPLTKPSLIHDVRRLSELDVPGLQAIWDQQELEERYRITLRYDFATTDTEIHRGAVLPADLESAEELLASITRKTLDRAKLPSRFAEVYPVVRSFVETRCFGRPANVEDDVLRSHLARLELQEAIANYLARKIAELTLERRAIEFDQAAFRLSQTRAFHWCRNLEPKPMEAKKTIFNYVATYNDFERRFGAFLDRSKDVVRFASLGTTEQGDSGSQFRVDYLKPSGAIGFYHPDWVLVQKTADGDVSWIVETKGRVWEGTTAKDEAMGTWCERVTAATGLPWRFVRVNQPLFDLGGWESFGQLVAAAEG